MKKIIFFLLIITLNSKVNCQINSCFYSLPINSYTITNHPQGHPLTKGDFNNDGHMDVAVASNNLIQIMLGDGTGNLIYGNSYNPVTVSAPMTNLTALNFDTNNNLDLMYSNNGNLYYLSGNGIAGFTPNLVSGIGCLNPGEIYAGKLDNNTTNDLILGSNCTPAFYSYLSSGNGNISSTNFANGSNPTPGVNSLVLIDVNNDGLNDIITANKNQNSITVYNGSSTNTYTNFTNYSISGSPIVIRKGDFNLDGIDDILTLNTSPYAYSVLLGTLTNTFAAPITTSLTNTAKYMDVADIDLDGILDLIISYNDLTGNIKIYKGIGNGNFSTSFSMINVGQDPARFMIADINNDFKNDIITANRGSGNIQIFLNGNVKLTVSSSSIVACSNQSVSASVIGAHTYTWNFGSNSSSILYSATINTILSVQGSNSLSSCTATALINLTIKPSPTINILGNVNSLCVGQTTSLIASGANTYSWNTGATNNMISVSPTVTTTYTVTGTNTNSCFANATVTQSVSACTGIETLTKDNSSKLLIYPNPNNGKFTIEATVDTNILLMDLVGKIILKQSITSGKNNIYLKTCAKGIYILKLENEPNSKYYKIVID